MTSNINMPIDDNLLAAYLDGRLDDEQIEYVENAIENNVELQWAVDRWLETQMGKTPTTDMEIGIKKAVVFNFKPRLKQVLSLAASVMVVLVLATPLFYKMGNINPDSGMSQGFPASNNRIPLEHSTNGNRSLIDPNSVVVADEPFTWNYEVYNNVLIIMWGQRMDTFDYKLYSANGKIMANGCTKNSHSEAISLYLVGMSDKPLWLSVKFRGPGVIVNDSIKIVY